MDFNLAVKNKWWNQKIEEELFGKNEIVHHISPTAKLDMFDILVLLGVYSSKARAKRRWTKTPQFIPSGFTDFYVGPHRITIWNPINWDIGEQD